MAQHGSGAIFHVKVQKLDDQAAMNRSVFSHPSNLVSHSRRESSGKRIGSPSTEQRLFECRVATAVYVIIVCV